jgi:hypothetical protein
MKRKEVKRVSFTNFASCPVSHCAKTPENAKTMLLATEKHRKKSLLTFESSSPEILPPIKHSL